MNEPVQLSMFVVLPTNPSQGVSRKKATVNRSTQWSEALSELSSGRNARYQRLSGESFGARTASNALIEDDNLAAMKGLLPSLASQVRCAYLDPPYNNGESYAHYHDDVSHATWLADIVARLVVVRELLCETGSVWISIDDSEAHYLKVAADGIFGRANFVASVVWEHRTTRENRRALSFNHEYVLVYARELRKFAASRNQLDGSEVLAQRYRNPDNDPRGPWQSISANVQDGHATPSQHYVLRAPNGKLHRPPKGRCWTYGRTRMQQAIDRGEVWFGRNGQGVPRLKKYLSDSDLRLNPSTLWPASEVGTTLSAKRHLLKLFPSSTVFDTPKPEGLLDRVLQIASNPGDLVLDPYLGSGTTAAVAMRLGRSFIGIESGSQLRTHAIPRLRGLLGSLQAAEGIGVSVLVRR